jgi:hypothetical protein
MKFYVIAVLGLIGLVGCGVNEVKESDVHPVLNKVWTGKLSDNLGGYYIQKTITLKITGNNENGYRYTLTDKVYDDYSMRITLDESFSGEMNREYTYWKGYLSSISMNVDRKYWEFGSGGAKGEYGLLVESDGIVDNNRIQLQLFMSDGTPGKFVNLR